jgi:hypothetical protein
MKKIRNLNQHPDVDPSKLTIDVIHSPLENRCSHCDITMYGIKNSKIKINQKRFRKMLKEIAISFP